MKNVDLFIENEPTPGKDYLGYCGKEADGTLILCWKSPSETIREVKVKHLTQVVKSDPQPELPKQNPWAIGAAVASTLAIVYAIQRYRKRRRRRRFISKPLV